MIWHLPHIRALAAWSGAPVTLVAKPRSAADQIFAAEAAVGQVIWMDRNPGDRRGAHDGPAGLVRLVALLHARRFARVVLLHHSRTLAMAAMAARIPTRHGYGFPAQRPFLNQPPYLPTGTHRLTPQEQALAWLAAAGIPITDPEPRLPVSEVARQTARTRLGALAGQPLALLGIGSSEPYKQWGAQRFAALIDALADAGWGHVALAGGPGEQPLAQEIMARATGNATILPALGWNLTELAALSEMAAFYVGNDTGALNLAAAVGTICYGLFGATPPLTHSKRIIPLLPPGGAIVPRGDGMARITPEAVLAAILADQPDMPAAQSSRPPQNHAIPVA